jgi:pimeloyl-ACP methyl ester carboxylesterase
LAFQVRQGRRDEDAMKDVEGSDPKNPDWQMVGAGPDALLLPALSSIAARQEMVPLATRLGTGLHCVIPDWPGFGARPRGRARLDPAAMRAFLDSLLGRAVAAPTIGIAAGHAATYLVEAALRHPGFFSRLVLVAPTWRGPLPTVMGEGRRPLCGRIRRTIELPGVGELLYRLNVSRPVLAKMMREHVYARPGHVTDAVIDAKLRITRQPDARFGTAAFVTGGLDPVRSRADFLALFTQDLPPVLMLRPTGAPRRSGAEMDALAATGRVTTVEVPGALSAHEEYPDEVARAITDFLRQER